MKPIKRLQMSRFANLIAVIVLIGMTLMPGTYLPCSCPPQCSNQQKTVPASCCSLPDQPAQSCCQYLQPFQPADGKTENRLLSWCMCNEQIRPAAVSLIPVFSDTSFVSTLFFASGASDTIYHKPPGAKNFSYKGLYLSSGRDILSTHCILLI